MDENQSKNNPQPPDVEIAIKGQRVPPPPPPTSPPPPTQPSQPTPSNPQEGSDQE